jgi:hypothetical protein
VRSLMERYAAELEGRADLHVVTDAEDERFDLVPRNEHAAPVTVEHCPTLDAEGVSIGFVAGALIPVHSTPDWPGWISWMDGAIAAVVAGRVVVREGPGRRQIEISMPDGGTYAPNEGDFPLGCLTLPGWRRRARVVQFEPY